MFSQLINIFQLLENHFIHLQELRKTISSTAPTKSLYLYYVDLYQVIRSVLQSCYKAASNLISRAQHEKESNARLAIFTVKLSRTSCCPSGCWRSRRGQRVWLSH